MDNGTIILTVAGTIVVAVISALASYAVRKSSSVSETQDALNRSFQEFVKVTTDRVERLEKSVNIKEKRILSLEAVIGNLRQHIQMLESLLKFHRIDYKRSPANMDDVIELNKNVEDAGEL